jgi:hypothetical protein
VSISALYVFSVDIPLIISEQISKRPIDIDRLMNCRGLRLVRDMARLGKRRNAYRILVGKCHF